MASDEEWVAVTRRGAVTEFTREPRCRQGLRSAARDEPWPKFGAGERRPLRCQPSALHCTSPQARLRPRLSWPRTKMQPSTAFRAPGRLPTRSPPRPPISPSPRSCHRSSPPAPRPRSPPPLAARARRTRMTSSLCTIRIPASAR